MVLVVLRRIKGETTFSKWQTQLSYGSWQAKESVQNSKWTADSTPFIADGYTMIVTLNVHTCTCMSLTRFWLGNTQNFCPVPALVFVEEWTTKISNTKINKCTSRAVILQHIIILPGKCMRMYVSRYTVLCIKRQKNIWWLWYQGWTITLRSETAARTYQPR